MVEPHFQRRVPFQRPLPPARSEHARRAVPDPRQWLFEPMGGWARDGGQRRPVASLQRPRPVPIRSLRELFPDCGRPRHAALRPQSRPRTAAFRSRLSPLDRAEQGNAAHGQGRAGHHGDARTSARRRSAGGPRAEWDFAAPRALPSGWINNAFLGWDGRATVLWPDRSLELEIEADPPLSTYILYSPSDEADFFCFEPVTHPVDAHNLPGGPEANGLTILAPKEILSAACRFSPKPLARDPVPAAPGIQAECDLHSNKRQ